MTPEIFYLQRNQRSFLSHLVKKLSTKETLPSWHVLCQEVTDPCPSLGAWRETLSTLIPPSQQICWVLKPACWSLLQWTITIVESTHAELRIQLECPLTLQNYKLMVIVWTGKHWNILFTEKPDILPFSFGREILNQGDFAQLTCVITRGDQPLSITWSLKGDIINSDPTLSTTMLGTQASMLVITAVDYHHSGVYTCRAENAAGVSTHSAELRVNGNQM